MTMTDSPSLVVLCRETLFKQLLECNQQDIDSCLRQIGFLQTLKESELDREQMRAKDGHLFEILSNEALRERGLRLRAAGDDANNWGRLGQVQNPDLAMNEIVTNQFDTVLMREASRQGMPSPETTVDEAAKKMLGKPEDPANDDRQQGNVFVILHESVARPPRNGAVNLRPSMATIDFVDFGTGIRANEWATTIMGAGRSSLKGGLRWQHGAYGQGCATAFTHVRDGGATIIASRHMDDPGVMSWTVVRPVYGIREIPILMYLVDEDGNVPRFSVPAKKPYRLYEGNKQAKPHKKGHCPTSFSHGTLVRLVRYRTTCVDQFTDGRPGNLASHFHYHLPNPPVPVLLRDWRDIKKKKTTKKNKEKTKPSFVCRGAFTRLRKTGGNDKRGNDKRIQAPVRKRGFIKVAGKEVPIEYMAMELTPGIDTHNPMRYYVPNLKKSIAIVYNGQVHDFRSSWPLRDPNRGGVYEYLADRIYVYVDLTPMKEDAYQILQTNREGLRDMTWDIDQAIVDLLVSDGDLREYEAKARKKAASSGTKASKSVDKQIEQRSATIDKIMNRRLPDIGEGNGTGTVRKKKKRRRGTREESGYDPVEQLAGRDCSYVTITNPKNGFSRDTDYKWPVYFETDASETLWYEETVVNGSPTRVAKFIFEIDGKPAHDAISHSTRASNDGRGHFLVSIPNGTPNGAVIRVGLRFQFDGKVFEDIVTGEVCLGKRNHQHIITSCPLRFGGVRWFDPDNDLDVEPAKRFYGGRLSREDRTHSPGCWNVDYQNPKGPTAFIRLNRHYLAYQQLVKKAKDKQRLDDKYSQILGSCLFECARQVETRESASTEDDDGIVALRNRMVRGLGGHCAEQIYEELQHINPRSAEDEDAMSSS